MSLAYLPKHKRSELKLIVQRIREVVKEAEMIILFGSYARDEWVEDIHVEGHITYEYKSDFDILVIVKNHNIANRVSLWNKAEKRARAYPVQTWVTIISHEIDFVNRRLRQGQYFFTDIKKEGILLYDSKKFKLERRRKLNPKERSSLAKNDFKQWFTSAKEFYTAFDLLFKRRKYKIAAFQLHQVVERSYAAVLLVFTHYKPRIHDIEKLGRMAAGCDPQLLTVFPQTTKEQQNCFKLLKRAYTEARYNPAYKITKAELEYLGQRVRKLQRLTRKICTAKIESFT